MQASILVLLPDGAERSRVAQWLEAMGHTPLEAETPALAETLTRELSLDVAVIDHELDVPSLGAEVPRVWVGGEAPDAVARPCHRDAVVERIEHVVRSDAPVWHLADRVIDLRRGEVRGPDRTPLTAKEVELLHVLHRAGGVVSSERLVQAVWGRAGKSTLSVTVRRLRQKIEADPSTPSFLRTRHGRGLELVAPEAPPTTPAPFGREQVVAAARHALQDGWVTLCGPPGVGRRDVARAVLPGSPLGPPPTHPPTVPRIVLAPNGLSGGQKEALLAGSPGIVVSYTPVGLPSEQVVWVDAFEPATAVRLLLAELPELASPERLAAALAFHPTTLRAAIPAARLVGEEALFAPWPERIALLEPELHELDEHLPGGPAADAALDLSWWRGPLPAPLAVSLVGPQMVSSLAGTGYWRLVDGHVHVVPTLRALVQYRSSPERRAASARRAAQWAWTHADSLAAVDQLYAAELWLDAGDPERAATLLSPSLHGPTEPAARTMWERLLVRTIDAGPLPAPLEARLSVLLAGLALPDAAETRGWLQRAAPLASDEATSVMLAARLGDAALYSGDADTAAQHFAEVARADPSKHAFAAFRLAHYLAMTPEGTHESLPQVGALLQAVRAHPVERMNIAMLRAMLLNEQGRGEEATHDYRECIAVARSHGDPHVLAAFLCTAGGAYVQQGRAEAGQRLLDEAMELRTAQGHVSGMASCIGNLAELASLRGNIYEAERLLDDATRRFGEAGHARGQRIALINLASLAARSRRTAAARQRLDAAWQGLSTTGLSRLAPYLHLSEAWTAFASDEDPHPHLTEGAEAATANRDARAAITLEVAALSFHYAAGVDVAAQAISLEPRAKRAGMARAACALAIWGWDADPSPPRRAAIEAALEITQNPTLARRWSLRSGGPPSTEPDLLTTPSTHTDSIVWQLERLGWSARRT